MIKKIITCKMNIEGENALSGTRPFLVGVWKYIITPLFMSLCILSIVVMLVSPKLVLVVLMVSVQTILGIIIGLYKFAFNKMDIIISSRRTV